MFLWNLLKKPCDELVKRVFLAQIDVKASDNSWVSQVKNELTNYNINLSFDEIAALSKSKFKSLVSQRIREKSNEYLSSLQEKHSKTKQLVIDKKVERVPCFPEVIFP